MPEDNIWFETLVEAGRQVQASEISSVELTTLMLGRIEKLEPKLRAFVTLTPDLALAQASKADAEIADGKVRSPLHGVPIAIKDLCNTKGIVTPPRCATTKEPMECRTLGGRVLQRLRCCHCGRALLWVAGF